MASCAKISQHARTKSGVQVRDVYLRLLFLFRTVVVPHFKDKLKLPKMSIIGNRVVVSYCNCCS